MQEKDTDQIIDDLLLDWETARLAGREISIVELCADMPEVVDRVAAKIAVLKQLSWIADPDEIVTEPPSLSIQTNSTTSLPDTDVTVDEFVQAVTESGVLSDADLWNLRQEVASDRHPRATSLAAELVAKGLLTLYQAKVILERGDSPLLLDRYVILDSIGAGGMGIVFKALQRSLERIVAVKVLPRHAVDSPEKVQRFQREMRAVAKISHPNVVQAFDAHESNGVYFFAMEYVSGNDLAELVLDQGPLPIRDCIDVLMQIAAGLENAHQHGIIHRDVKPSNVLLRDDGVAKVLDLGLSRTREVTRETTANELTRDGLAMGTVSYMSPEQAFDAKQATEKSDIYSLGCTLYFLIHGHPMFDESNAVQTIVAHRESPAPRLGNGRDGVPGALENLFQRMVAKAPEDRPSSMTEVRRALLECQRDGSPDDRDDSGPKQTPDVIQKPSAMGTSSTPHRRSWWTWIAAAVLAVAALGVGTKRIIDFATVAKTDNKGLATALLEDDSISLVVETVNEIIQVDFTEDLPDDSFKIVGVIYYVDRSVELQSISALPDLKSLTLLGAGDVASRSIAPLGDLAQFPGLESFDIQGFSLNDEAASQIAHLHGLRSLTIIDCETADGIVARITGELTDLRELVLNQLSINDAEIASLAKLEQLEYLALDNTKVTSGVLRQLIQLPRLTELSLTGIQIRGELDALAELPSLQALHLDATNLTDGDVPAIAAIPELKYLDVSHTKLTANGIKKLVQANQIEDLWVEGLPIQLAAAEIGKLSALRSLNLHNSDINDDGLSALYELRDLTALYLGGTPTTEAAIDRLRLRLPRCDVQLTHPDEWPTEESVEFVLERDAP